MEILFLFWWLWRGLWSKVKVELVWYNNCIDDMVDLVGEGVEERMFYEELIGVLLRFIF